MAYFSIILPPSQKREVRFNFHLWVGQKLKIAGIGRFSFERNGSQVKQTIGAIFSRMLFWGLLKKLALDGIQFVQTCRP